MQTNLLRDIASLKAYEMVTGNGSANKRRREVYLTISQLGECTDLEISRASGIPINVVTPRRGELLKGQIVEKAGTKKQNNTTVNTWKLCRSR